MSGAPTIANPLNAPAGPGAAPLLEIYGLTVEFPQYGEQNRPALIDIDFTIARGEVVGLVGESG
jgi:ABC-type glutathione transport system ATPase component